MDISVKALQQAVSLRRQIDELEKRFSLLLRGAAPSPTGRAPRIRKKGKPTSTGRRKVSGFLKYRPVTKKAGGAEFAPGTRGRLSALMKARWAARGKAAKKKGTLPTLNTGTRYH
jgi:hypothetical protein